MNPHPPDDTLRLVIHAPTEAALARARANAANLLRAEPAAAVEIVINGPAVAAALASPHDGHGIAKRRHLLLPDRGADAGKGFAL